MTLADYSAKTKMKTTPAPGPLAPYPTWFISLSLDGRAYIGLGWRAWLHRPPKRGAYDQATYKGHKSLARCDTESMNMPGVRHSRGDSSGPRPRGPQRLFRAPSQSLKILLNLRPNSGEVI